MKLLLTKDSLLSPRTTFTNMAQPTKPPTPRQSAARLHVVSMRSLDRDTPVYDVVAAARSKVSPPRSAPPAPPVTDFVRKLKAAWHIFFPPKPESVTPKEECKSRLRMILVADRCGMNQSSMYEMRHSIVKAVSDYVDIEAEELVEVNITTDPDMGTIYSVAVPVRRVKPQARLPSETESMEADGITLSWDADDKLSDPSERFPYGC